MATDPLDALDAFINSKIEEIVKHESFSSSVVTVKEARAILARIFTAQRPIYFDGIDLEELLSDIRDGQ